jgi:hypothetical protein
MNNQNQNKNETTATQGLILAAGTAIGASLLVLHLGGCATTDSANATVETTPMVMNNDAMFAVETEETMVFAETETMTEESQSWSSPAYRDGWYEDMESFEGNSSTQFASYEVESDSTEFEQKESVEMPVATDNSAMRNSMFAPYESFASDDKSETTEGILAQVSYAEIGADFDADVDATGKFVVYASTQHNHTADIYRKAIGGRTNTQLTSDNGQDVMPEISPDGKRIAFASDRNGNWDVYVMSVNGGPAMQVTFGGEHEMHPTWSPDGTSIAYCRYNQRSAQWEIWYAEVDRPSVRSFVCEGMFPRWSPDNNTDRLLFQRTRKRGERLYGVWTIEMKDGNSMNPTEIFSADKYAIMHPSWSPDGQSIVFTTVRNPEVTSDGMPMAAEIWTVGLDGSKRFALTSDGFRNMRPNWSSNGKVFFTSNRNGVDNIWSVSSSSFAGEGFNPSTVATGSED